MKIKKCFFWGLLAVFLTVGMIAGCGGGKTDIEGNGFFDVTADGSSELSTTKLNFHFYEPITGFSVDNIILSFSADTENGESKSGESVVKKGTLSGSGQEYVLPISGFSSSGNLEVKVEISGRTGSSGVYIYYYPAKEGIYIGIIKFAGNAEAINLNDNYNYYPGEFNNNETNSDAPVLLDQSSKQQIENRLNSNYQIAAQPGTAVYYAVHKALANLSSSENWYPKNLDSVYVITFTDGLDNASGGQSRVSPIENKSFDTTPAYVTYVKNEITTRKIAGIGVTAYSIGVKGTDVQDTAEFTTSLENIASPGKNRELNNFDDIQSTFNEIAEGLIQGSNFTLTTTLLDSGTKVRMTFDIDKYNPTPQDAEASAKYIEGTITASGNTYTFTNITYTGGISSSVGAGPITGTVSGTTVNFLFSNIAGYNFATDRPKTKQWTKAPSAPNWNINSEYSSVKTDFGTTVIYLVLDCSTSMNYSDIYQIKDAVRTFINKIYTSRYEDGY